MPHGAIPAAAPPSSAWPGGTAGDAVPHDVAAHQAATDALLQSHADQARRVVLVQSYLGTPPTWIQHASTVNLAEFPSLTDPTEQAERQLRTIEWLIEDRERSAREARQAGAEAGAQVPTGAEHVEHWLHWLLPTHWLPVLREHGDTVVAGGAVLLVLTWTMGALAQRVPAASRRRRRRRHRSAAARGVSVPAPTMSASPLPSGRRRRRRHHSRSSALRNASASRGA